jgi:hypothetical protein
MTDTDPTFTPRRGRGAEPTIDVVEVAPPSRAYAENGGIASGAAVLRWDGVPTEFTLARPLIRNHTVLREGAVVRFNVMPHPALKGVFIGSDDPAIPDESQHVMDLYAQGMFAGTNPAADRTRRQNAIDFERGVLDGGEDGVPMTSLAPLDGVRTEELLRRHRGIGTPEQMRAAERTVAREGAAPAWPGAEAPGTARRTGPQP